jgi:hypothetical protein
VYLNEHIINRDVPSMSSLVSILSKGRRKMLDKFLYSPSVAVIAGSEPN